MIKTFLVKLLCVAAILSPLCSSAQNDVRKAFDELLKSSSVEYSETHSMSKDSSTGVKESQSDVYTFTLPAANIKLVDNILKAFKSDESKAYSISGGKADKGSARINLAVGDGRGRGVLINPIGYDYYYACFLAPKKEDKDGIYRYAYGINWRKKKDKIEGTLVVTYATTLKYRQEASKSRGAMMIVGAPADSWFETMVTYMRTLSRNNSTSNQEFWAARIYKLAQSSQSLKDLSNDDKTAARELLKSKIDGTEKFTPTTRQLLISALNSIK